MLPKGPALHKYGLFSRVWSIRLYCVTHDDGHRSCCLELLGGHRLAGRGVADDDPPEARPQILQRRASASTAMTSDAAVMSKAGLARRPVLARSEARNYVAERPVVDGRAPFSR